MTSAKSVGPQKRQMSQRAGSKQGGYGQVDAWQEPSQGGQCSRPVSRYLMPAPVYWSGRCSLSVHSWVLQNFSTTDPKV